VKKQGVTPATVVTDKLGSYSSALRELGIARRHDTGRWKNNRAENSHQPLRQRERRMKRFKSPGSGYADMAPSDSRSVNRCGHGHLACKFPTNVTVPVSDKPKRVHSLPFADFFCHTWLPHPPAELSPALACQLQRTRVSASADKRLRHGVKVDLFAADHDDRC
jgi:hypothetical protein